MKATIVGAGIGGLTTALFLNKHNIDCEGSCGPRLSKGWPGGTYHPRWRYWSRGRSCQAPSGLRLSLLSAVSLSEG